MAKITYASLKLKVNEAVETVDFQDSKIEVLQYLPIELKNELVQVALQNAEDGDLYNPIVLDMYLHLYMIYLYTNITFTEKQKEDEIKLYNTLQSNGLIEAVLEKIPEEEYDLILTYADKIIQDKTSYKTSTAGMIKTIIDTLPAQMERAASIANELDLSKFEKIMAIAKETK